MADRGGLREAAQEVARRAASVARLQSELARSELKSSSALAFGAAVFGVFAFALFTTLLVAALAIPLPVWLSVLIVMVLYLIAAGVLGSAFRRTKGAPLAKQQARVTATALRLRHGGDIPSSGEANDVVSSSSASPSPARNPGAAESG